MKNKVNNVHKGFTLVELLIVIVVIGILSAMMMLSSTEAVSSAKANNIVSNLRNLKTAALAMYVDHNDFFDKNTNFNVSNSFDVVKKYLSQGDSAGTNWEGYSIVHPSNTTNWFVTYGSTNSNTPQIETKVGEKLKNRAVSVGLLNSASKPTDTNLNTYAGGKQVWMFVR